MKKIAAVIIALITLFLLLPSSAKEMTIFYQHNKIVEQSQIMNFDGTLFVPARQLCEAIGSTIEWFGESRSVSLTRGDISIKMKIDDPNVLVNEIPQTVNIAPKIINELTYVPLRFVAESFDCFVMWEEKFLMHRNSVLIYEPEYYDVEFLKEYKVPKITAMVYKNGGVSHSSHNENYKEYAVHEWFAGDHHFAERMGLFYQILMQRGYTETKSKEERTAAYIKDNVLVEMGARHLIGTGHFFINVSIVPTPEFEPKESSALYSDEYKSFDYSYPVFDSFCGFKPIKLLSFPHIEVHSLFYDVSEIDVDACVANYTAFLESQDFVKKFSQEQEKYKKVEFYNESKKLELNIKLQYSDSLLSISADKK